MLLLVLIEMVCAIIPTLENIVRAMLGLNDDTSIRESLFERPYPPETKLIILAYHYIKQNDSRV